ncbi:NAD(P)H-dependent oxidoreductase subunit E [Oscillospiraceae bacterium HV4-5-C5C]|nr:NAD(P)H-dependent oxidoreductase subunit E [Oscillospiraceae bacterium HV4-5-C5C]
MHDTPRTPVPQNGPEADLYRQLIEYIKTKEPKESSLIDVMHFTQDLFGYVPKTAQLLIGEMLNIHTTKVYGVLTFYNYFTEVPKGRYAISVCLGTACYVKGGAEVLAAFSKELGIKPGDTTADRLFSIVQTRCLGDCSNAPIVMINDDLLPKVTVKQVPGIIARYRKLAQDCGQAAAPAGKEAVSS